ncbi:MAG: hypothetical protein WA902_14755, partial [Thermosynechococcaceae cyanobacterium]
SRRTKTEKTSKHIMMMSCLLIGTFSIKLFGSGGMTYMGQQYKLPEFPFSLDIVPITVFYFLLGNNLKGKAMAFRPSQPLILLSLLLFGVCHLCFNSTIDLNGRIYDDAFISTTEALAGIYIVLCISYYLQFQETVSSLLAKTGCASLFVLIFHDFFQLNSFKLAARFLGESNYICIVFSFIVGSAFPVLVWLVVKRIDLIALFFLPIKSNPVIQRLHRRAEI